MALEAMGFEQPSEIQAAAIPSLIEGKDIIGQAQTGTGKTAAFGIPCVQNIDSSNPSTQALILCPTRELALQVSEELKKLTKFQEEVSVVCVYGGQDIRIQLRALKKESQIIVGTPGRIMDHLKRGSLVVDQLKYVVLDEADQMLDMGFRDDMEKILSQTPEGRQTVMFSATMTRVLMELMKKYQNNPEHINTVGEQKHSKQINQLYFHINGETKFEALKRLLAFYNISSCLIFCNTRNKVDELSQKLRAEKFSTAALHGEIEQKKRDKVMQEFKQGHINLLIATDVAARGLDVNDLEAVINYDLPRFDQDYVHRIGRTGRAGKAGLALSFVVGRELDHLNRIARKNNMNIQASKIPHTKNIEKTGFENLKTKLENSEFKHKDLSKYTKLLEQIEIYGFEPADMAAILLKTLLEKESISFDEDVNFEPVKPRRSGNDSRRDGGRDRNRSRNRSDRNRPRSNRRGKPGSHSKGSGSSRNRSNRNRNKTNSNNKAKY